MEITLFKVICNNCECNTQFMTNSTEHTICPNCGEESIHYENDTIVATYNEKTDYSTLIFNKVEALVGILIASTYSSGDCVIARYDDNQGFRLNLKQSTFTDKILEILNLSSINDLNSLIYDELDKQYEIHSVLIYDPIFECIERESYTDEHGCLYESSEVIPSIAEEFFNFILENSDSISKIFKK